MPQIALAIAGAAIGEAALGPIFGAVVGRGVGAVVSSKVGGPLVTSVDETRPTLGSTNIMECHDEHAAGLDHS